MKYIFCIMEMLLERKAVDVNEHDIYYPPLHLDINKSKGKQLLLSLK